MSAFYRINSRFSLLPDEAYRVLLVDGSFLRTRAADTACSIYLQYYRGIFNIQHIYQYVCLKSAILCYQSLLPLISSSVEEILIFNDIQSKTNQDLMMRETVNIVPQYLTQLFLRNLKIKELTRQKRRNCCNIVINREAMSSIEVRKRVGEELKTQELKTQELKTQELKTRDSDTYINYLRTHPFLNVYIPENTGTVILAILCYFLKSHFPHLTIKLLKSFLEADFSIYHYVYTSYVRCEKRNLLIVSSDTDYYICGYNPYVYLYNMTEFLYPYQFWNILLFRYYDETVNRADLLLRVSFLFGNDYFFYDILKNDSNKKLAKLYMLLNIEQKFRSIPYVSEGKQLKNFYNSTTTLMNRCDKPFTPEMLDLIIVSGLPNKYKSIYVTCVYCIKYVTQRGAHHVAQFCDYSYDTEDHMEDFSMSHILSLLRSEIKQESLLKNHSNLEVNPFLYKEFNNNDSLYTMMRYHLSDRLLNRVNPVKKMHKKERYTNLTMKLREEDLTKDYDTLIDLVNINLN